MVTFSNPESLIASLKVSLNLICTFPYPNSLLFPSGLPRPAWHSCLCPDAPFGLTLFLTVQSLSFLDGACRLERTVWAEDGSDSDFPNAIKYLAGFQRCKWMAVVLWDMEPGLIFFFCCSQEPRNFNS